MAVDWDEVPVIGAFASVGAILAEVLVQSGDLIVMLLMGLIQTIDLWLPMLSYLNQLAEQTPLPADLTSQLLTYGLVLMVAYYAYRVVNNVRKQIQNNGN